MLTSVHHRLDLVKRLLTDYLLRVDDGRGIDDLLNLVVEVRGRLIRYCT
jgi:hypothetical protein